MPSLKLSIVGIILFYLCVHCQQDTRTYPHVSFNGAVLRNHSYVSLSLVGSDSNSVQCNTDLSTCCTASAGLHRGDWYFPSGSRVESNEADIYRSRAFQKVLLRRRNNGNIAGIFRCDVATNAVQNDDDTLRDSVYVGLYLTGGQSLFRITSNM